MDRFPELYWSAIMLLYVTGARGMVGSWMVDSTHLTVGCDWTMEETDAGEEYRR